MKPWIVAVTGGIGSGKSTVCRSFAKLGIQTVDTDEIAKALTLPSGAAIPAITERFGAEFISPDGAMDRVAMRKLVYANPQARENLESILHPMIRNSTLEALAQAPGPYVLLGIPLLAESGKASYNYRRVVVVDCLPEEQLARVMQRNQLTKAEVQSIMKAQVDRATRLKLADDVILNFDQQPDLDEQVRRLDAIYRHSLLVLDSK